MLKPKVLWDVSVNECTNFVKTGMYYAVSVSHVCFTWARVNDLYFRDSGIYWRFLYLLRNLMNNG